MISAVNEILHEWGSPQPEIAFWLRHEKHDPARYGERPYL